MGLDFDRLLHVGVDSLFRDTLLWHSEVFNFLRFF